MAPGDARHTLGHRQRTPRLAREDNRGIRPTHSLTAVVVAISVRQQTQSSRGTDLQQGDRLLQSSQERKQHCASPGLVGLGTSSQHQVTKLVRVGQDESAERPVRREHTGQILRSTEQEVRLPFGARKRLEEGKDVGVLCYAECEPLVARRDTPHLALSECSVPLRRLRHGSMLSASCERSSDSQASCFRGEATDVLEQEVGPDLGHFEVLAR